MNSILNAETSASKVLSVTDKEHSIGRNPSDQGNTDQENKLVKPLNNWDKPGIIRAAMNKAHNRNFEEWGHDQLASLLDYHRDGSLSLNICQEFFTDLLLFLGKPKISKAFNKEVEGGLQRLRSLTSFVNQFRENTGYDEWADYCNLSNLATDDREFIHLARTYLTGSVLEQVLAVDEDPRDALRKAKYDAALKDAKQEFIAAVGAAAIKRPAIFKNDEELVAALDKYFPGVEWPVDKKIVILDPDVKRELEIFEKVRLERENETLEQRQARDLHVEIKEAMYSKVSKDIRERDAASMREWAKKEAEKMKKAGNKKVKPAGGAVTKKPVTKTTRKKA